MSKSLVRPITVIQLSQALGSGETSSIALVNATLNQIEQKDPQLHAFIEVTPNTARADANASDARRLAGNNLGPLDGVPVAIKGNIALQGIATTDGTRAFAHRIATQDAFVVTRLRSAGAVIVGTLNMHEGALGATTDNQFWGQCQNPLAPGFTPGGSSGGSAASVAAGIIPLTLGTDTMGSIRIPAAYCGLWGLKPTHVSYRGKPIDCAGFSNRGASSGQRSIHCSVLENAFGIRRPLSHRREPSIDTVGSSSIQQISPGA
jgi:aspartyl-tRNA(Asn)/glutamyl-tRNA(Gln) amidotransferase subunit A